LTTSKTSEARNLISRRGFGLGLLPFLSGAAVAAPKVDLALVLAIDCSYSVDQSEYALQMSGTAQALMAPEVLQAVRGGLRKQIALAAFLWSEPANHFMLVPWQLLRGPEDAMAIGNMFLRAPRDVPRGTTATGSALLFAQMLLEDAPPAMRHVIDISTDGECNEGPKVEGVRNALVAKGTVINGLAITTDTKDLDDYMKQSVIGGHQSFVIKTNDFGAYGHTLRIKLFREIAGVDII
jgi:hypothetical protein